MKFLSFPGLKFIRICLGFLFLSFFFGCQKDKLGWWNGYVSDSQSTAFVNSGASNFIVITKSETLPNGFEAQISAYCEIVNSIPEIGQVIVKPTDSKFYLKVSNFENVLAVVPDIVIRGIDPEEIYGELETMSIGDNETFFSYQWGMDAIDAPEAWDAGYTGQGARVFIIDNGIDADNPDLSPNLNKVLSKSFVPDENYYISNGRYFHHGTHVAGIIAAADNNWGVIGVAPHAEIVAVKVLSEYTGSGSFSWINAGIVYAADNGADVINMSLGGTFYKNGLYIDPDGILQKVPAVYIQNYILANKRAVKYAFNKGAVIIAAAGNDASDYDGNGPVFTMPAEQEDAIAVSATAPECWALTPIPQFDILASYSNYGYSLVEIAAPGGDFDCTKGYPYDMILSTGSGPDPVTRRWSFYFSSGTSMASPHVAGVAALIIGKNGGEMDPNEVIKQLFKTADKVDGEGISEYFGNGRVNAYRAVAE